MANWSKYPFVRMLIPFALGIWTRVFFPSLQVDGTTLFVALVALFAMAALSAQVLKSQRNVWLFGAVMACYLFVAGFSLTRFQEASAQKDHYRNHEVSARYYVARICEYPSERENSIRAQLQIEYQFCDSLPSREVTGRVMAYFQKTDAALALRYGDLIAIPAPIAQVAPPKNPDEFDYRAYLWRKGVTGQTYLKEQDWVDLQVNDANPLFAFSYRFRDLLLASLKKCGLKDHELGVAAAILLGYNDYLEDEMRQKYVAAGSMHILCVSGLHVGIIYLMASFLLGLLMGRRGHKVTKNVVLLLIVWLYALIAGLSPSILRSAIMISLVIIGDMLERKGFAINSIAASAFVLLCVNPFNLFEIGFQLSYAAVIGIVMLQKPIYRLFFLKNRLLDRIWDITAVTLAAQVATIPFTLFYFQQFTTYFWLSNLFLTPISFVVVMGGMMLLMVSWIPYVNVAMGYLVWGTIYVMNFIVSWVDNLPASIIKGLYVSQLEFALLLIAIVLLLLLVGLRKKRILFELLSVMLLFMLSLTIRLYSSDNQCEIIFFSLRKHTAVDFVLGRQHVLLADSALVSDGPTVDYSLTGAWTRRGLPNNPEVIGFEEDYDGCFLRKRGNLLSFEGKLMALWDDGFWVPDRLSYRLPLDYLLVREKQKPDVQSVINAYETKLLIIDGSVPSYLAEQWKKQAEAFSLPCHNAGEMALECSVSN